MTAREKRLRRERSDRATLEQWMAIAAAAPATIPVTRLAPGISGEDLQNARLAALKPRVVWLRGVQRVRIRAVTPNTVTFTELDHGRSERRRVSVSAFLRTSRPEVMR